MGADGTLETASRTIRMVWATPCLRLNQEKKQAKVKLNVTELANPSVLMRMMMRVSSQNDLHQCVAEEWCGGLMRDKDYSKLEASSTMPHF